jgi:hypothetical protein
MRTTTSVAALSRRPTRTPGDRARSVTTFCRTMTRAGWATTERSCSAAPYRTCTESTCTTTPSSTTSGRRSSTSIRARSRTASSRTTSSLRQDNGETPSWATIDGNDWHTATGGTAVWATNGMTYTSFGAYQSGTGREKKSVTTDPDLSAPGTGGACNSSTTAGTQTCPSQYLLESGSPVAGTGLDLTRAPYSLAAGVGATDYYLRPIPNGQGTGYDVGAY